MEVENHLNWTEGLINAIDYIETHLIDGEVLDQNTIARLTPLPTTSEKYFI